MDRHPPAPTPKGRRPRESASRRGAGSKARIRPARRAQRGAARGPEGGRGTGGRWALAGMLALLALIPGLHAAPAWQPAVAAALLANAGILVLAFVVVSVLHMEHFKGTVHDEFNQLLITALFAAMLLAGLGELERFMLGVGTFPSYTACNPLDSPIKPLGNENLTYCSTGLAIDTDSGGKQLCSSTPPIICRYKPTAASLNMWAVSVVERQQTLIQKQMAAATEFNARLGTVSSVSGFCNLMGVGLSVAGCSSYGAMRGPTGQIITALGTGLMELRAESILLDLSERYALALLLPLGLLMRGLHLTRKAGGTLIALALAFHLVLPLSILLGQAMADGFVVQNPHLASTRFPDLKVDIEGLQSGAGGLLGGLAVGDYLQCDPFDPDEGAMVATVNAPQVHHPDADAQEVTEDIRMEAGSSLVERLMFLVVIRTLFMGALALTLTLGAVRIIGMVSGAEIEVGTIARLS